MINIPINSSKNKQNNHYDAHLSQKHKIKNAPLLPMLADIRNIN